MVISTRGMESWDWAGIVNALLRRMVLSQSELGARCGVAQQTVANWKSGVRRPGHKATRHLLGLIKQSGIKLDKFGNLHAGCEIEKTPFLASVSCDSNGDSEELLPEWQLLSSDERRQLLDFARFLEWKRNGKIES